MASNPPGGFESVAADRWRRAELQRMQRQRVKNPKIAQTPIATCCSEPDLRQRTLQRERNVIIENDCVDPGSLLRSEEADTTVGKN